MIGGEVALQHREVLAALETDEVIRTDRLLHLHGGFALRRLLC